ncbi:outer membrane protein assembly factor BamA [Verrucomicrobiaceae bacterium N1E253]|uniref:Outer membrane protein assembly factor BamA n=1 Tax=Oceaniferula marina TaxID=2748318 RepID=A0A851GHL0_9BACT|nr:outer membrane protein assembly factor BamA [Oceaniferula marina]NWK55361.1 outer membrane protein assembly factor BamA [Oceaniferula marina]
MKSIPQYATALAGFILFLSGTVTSLAQDFEGKNISSVSIRYKGARTVDEARLRGHMSVKAGQKYSASRLDDDVRTLYESGLVDDIRFFAEEVGGGVKVIAEVSTRGKIVAVAFDGNIKFSDKKLASVTKLKAGGVMSDQAILDARRNILDHYRGYGYADVGVDHMIQPSAGAQGTSDLVFLIDEGARAEVRKIRFEGNHSIASHKLRNEMKTKQKGWFSFFTKSGRIDSAKLDEDIDRVLDYYRDRGYLRVKADIRRAPVDDERVDLVIAITEGNKYTVAAVGFGKMTVFKASDLASALTLTAGQAYSAKKMHNDIRTIRSYYGSRGYADAAVSPDIRNASATSVSITYRIVEGGRYRVGRVTIEGNDKTQDRVIRRELPLKPGDYLNSVEMETTKRRLRNMNYFNDVQVSGSPGNQKGYRDINILVNEKQTGSVSFGLGFSSVDSIVGYVTLEQTNFDITDWPSFTGAGQRFNAKVQYGNERQDISLNWTEPWFLGRRLALGTELFYRSALYYSSEYDQGQYGGAISLRKPLGKRGYIRAEYRIEDIEIDVDSDNIGVPPAQGGPSLFEQYDGDYIRSALSVNYVHDTRDSNQLPRKGHKVSVGIEYAGLGGDVDTPIYTLTGSQYWNLWGDSILSIEGNFYIADGDEDVEIFDKKALGGAHSLRGFENRDVGPRDPVSGEVVGGNTAAFFVLEYTFPLIERVRGAVFYDVGLCNADSWDFSSDLYHDAGLGLRLNLPFGPLAVDYAFPLESPDDEADNGGQFSFYLDYAF